MRCPGCGAPRAEADHACGSCGREFRGADGGAGTPEPSTAPGDDVEAPAAPSGAPWPGHAGGRLPPGLSLSFPRTAPFPKDCAIAALAVWGWFVVLTGNAWYYYLEGVLDLSLPLWNSFFLVLMGIVFVGVCMRLEVARAWANGAATFTALLHVYRIGTGGPGWLAIGVVILGVAAWRLRRAKLAFVLYGPPSARVARASNALSLLFFVLCVIFFIYLQSGGGLSARLR